MNNILNIYKNILQSHISNIFKNKQHINPILLNRERYKVRGVFISTILFLQHNSIPRQSNYVLCTDNWLQSTFSKNNLFSEIIKQSNSDLCKYMNAYIEKCDIPSDIHIPTLYELLLSVETKNENKLTKTTVSKNYRNKLGSYYTPELLAKNVTKKTIDKFFELNFGIKIASNNSKDNDILTKLSSITYVDFSCGGGIFLMEIILYYETLFNHIKYKEKKKYIKNIIKNIFAFDVDCQALEIAKLNLLLKAEVPEIYIEVNANYTHGNFLIHTDEVADVQTKRSIFSDGYIYHQKLGLNINNLRKFDIILGNPPWEKIRFERKRFYELYSNSISDINFNSNLSQKIFELEKDSYQLKEFATSYKNEIEMAKRQLKKNVFFELSSKGELNTYALFTDASLHLKSSRGVVGLILKSGILTSQVNKTLLNFLVKNNKILEIFDFINKKKIFQIDSRERFCVLILGNSKSNRFAVAMNLLDIDDIKKVHHEIYLSEKDLAIINPSTRMLPNFTNKNELDFIIRVSREFHSFNRVFDTVKFGRIVHFTSHSEFISKTKDSDNLPIYEGKFFNQFDNKYSGFNEVDYEDRYGSKSFSLKIDEKDKEKLDFFPESRYFIQIKKWNQLSKNYTEDFMLCWRSLTSATNNRTCIATILPFCPASQSVQFLTSSKSELIYLLGLFNSLVFDYIVRKKLNGIDLTQTIIKQIPVPNINKTKQIITLNGRTEQINHHISKHIAQLYKNDIYINQIFLNSNMLNQYSKFELIRNLDLLFMYLYNISESEIKLICIEFQSIYTNNDIKWFKKMLHLITP